MQYNNRSNTATVIGLINHSSSDIVLLNPEQERGDWHYFISAPRARPSTMRLREPQTVGGTEETKTATLPSMARVRWPHECCTVLLASPGIWEFATRLKLRMTGCKLKIGDRAVECEAQRGFHVHMRRSKSRELPWLITITDGKSG